MIGIYGVKDKNQFVLEFENEDILFMETIINLIGERNSHLKEIKALKEEEKTRLKGLKEMKNASIVTTILSYLVVRTQKNVKIMN